MTEMSLKAALMRAAVPAFETKLMPDAVTRLAIHALVGATNRELVSAPADATANFARHMLSFPIAVHTDAANAQHYEIPAAFFELVLGPQRKYSCCYFWSPGTTLAEAEEQALAETAAHAGIADGQSILELGCGWGSLSLWMARMFPKARITAVSNSRSQRVAIEERAKEMGLHKLRVVTADANSFDPGTTFDRVVSIEMFEHMSNWPALLQRARSWLTADGRLFLHVFTHRTAPYRFDEADPADWIAQHFFSGGIMPSEKLVEEFGDLFSVERRWRWSGEHYARTASEWLANFDRSGPEVMRIFDGCYGRDAALWYRRWRLFFLATAGLFGYDAGRHWGVIHYLLRPEGTR